MVAIDLSQQGLEDRAWWANQMPHLKRAINKSQVAVVGYSPDQLNSTVWKFGPSLRIEALTTEAGIRYRVVKNMMGASQGKTIVEMF